ncbi:MAG: hypothetical protein GY799_24655 [Desulfobulbaceae bacterium]|nr:hypothetical protein [Desulfobulbaceae bacterium]
MERCPLCKARLRAKRICNRCEADLSLLQTIESEADQLAKGAVHSLLAGEMEAASRQASAARDLQATTFHQALSGFIETMAGEEFVRHTPSDMAHGKD